MNTTNDLATTQVLATDHPHMRKPDATATEGTAVEDAETLAREEALRHSTVRVPR